jgi:4-hydroxyphenylpyruvate dioxygenase
MSMVKPAHRPSGLGILAWDLYEFVVDDLDRSRRFYREMMQIPELATLDRRIADERGEEAALFAAGQAPFVCIAPKKDDSAARRWLKRHPDGVSRLSVRVRDIETTWRVLHERNATFCDGEIVEAIDHKGRPYRSFDIASPLGDVRFRFVQREDGALPPDFKPHEGYESHNPLGFRAVDHVTSNFLTIGPHVSWLRDVLGFEEYWRVHFHTKDAKGMEGSGLASIVMWDPESGIKLANNEPASPNYEQSQIYRFVEDNNGPGVQHIAFNVPRIQPTVDGLRRAGIEFLDTPVTYYDMLPSRLARQRVTKFDENIDELKRLGILVDGADDRYLLQIFMVEGGVMYDDRRAGPFFYEVIQRCGAPGFGEGNFRALFEAIERDQEQREIAQRQLRAGAGS